MSYEQVSKKMIDSDSNVGGGSDHWESPEEGEPCCIWKGRDRKQLVLLRTKYPEVMNLGKGGALYISAELQKFCRVTKRREKDHANDEFQILSLLLLLIGYQRETLLTVYPQDLKWCSIH